MLTPKTQARTLGRSIRHQAADTGPRPGFKDLADGYVGRMTPRLYRRLADRLGVSVVSLERLGVGWDGDSWTFPMSDGQGHVIGIHRRFPNGFKCCIGRSQLGLFIPSDLTPTGDLYVTEGASDCAAALTLGLTAIGRPSCCTGANLVARFAGDRQVVIVGDGDPPGRKGAQELAEPLALHCPCVKIIFPPDGIKDLRAWLEAGLTRETLLAEIERTEPVALEVR